ncbi:MAG: hypothetical protein WAU31_02465 [Candidatus Moraniibacteriota bacterium]
MQIQSAQRPLSVGDAYVAMQGWDISLAKKFLAEREGFDCQAVEEMSEEYKRFISLCAVHATREMPLPISDRVDPLWHAHILYTDDYVGMSRHLGVSYLHHAPASGDELAALEPHYNRTLALYEQNFGKPSEKYWPPFAQICGGSNCSCSGTGND